MQIKHLLTASMAGFLALTYSSCSKSSGTGTTPPPAQTASVLIKTDDHFGKILTDPTGVSLYFFALDAHDTSACSGDCAVNWPPFNATDITVVGSGLNASDFASITRTDGSKQTTYKGWPLYTFKNDVTSGGGYGTPVSNTVSGDGVGKIWFVAKPDYTVMIAKTQLVGADGINYDSTYAAKTASSVYMTNDHGVTFYAYSPDHAGQNTWTASDLSNNAFWPIVELAGVQNVPSVLNKADFSSITVFGKTQLTFKGWPVYYFGGDAQKRGSNKGVSVPTPGIWPIMDQYSAAAPE